MNSPVILITGAGKGIGEACVRELVTRARAAKPQGFLPRLVLTSRTLADLERLKAEAGSALESDLEMEIVVADFAQAPTAALAAAVKKFGRVDVCLHSAGIGRFGNFLEISAEDVSKVLQTNVQASFIFMQALYRQMQAQARIGEDEGAPGLRGQIQWITSVAAERPFEQSALYCMSKYAQRGLIEVMRLYGYKDGVRILEVKPGAAHTPMWGEVPAEMKARMMLASDVAQAMVDAIFISPRATIEEITIRPLGGDI